LGYAISSPSEVAACSCILDIQLNRLQGVIQLSHLLGVIQLSHLLGVIQLSHLLSVIQLNHLLSVTQLNHLLGVSSHFDTICHNWKIEDTYINSPSMAMPIAILICCVAIAKRNNKCSQMYLNFVGTIDWVTIV